MRSRLKAAVALLALAGGLAASGSAFAFPEPYCVRNYGDVEPITLVNFDGINNTTSATLGGTADEDFTLTVGQLRPGATYPIVVKGNTGEDGGGPYTDAVAVYIDWNRNSTFDANEGYFIGALQNSSGTDAKQVAALISIPAAATAGQTRMRVVKQYTSAASPTIANSPACGTTGFGQAEDYTVNVDPGAPAPAYPKLSKTFAPAAGDVSRPTTLTLSLGQYNAASASLTLTANLVDTFPIGMTVATTPNASTTCPGTGSLIANAGANTITLGSGAEIPPAGCTVQVDVRVTNPGVYANTLPSNSLKTSGGDFPSAVTAYYQSNASGSTTYNTGFEAPTFAVGNLGSQGGWGVSAAALATDFKIATTSPAVGTQHLRASWTAAGTDPVAALSPTQPVILTPYSVAAAKLKLTVSGSGANFDFAPQDPAASSVVARVRFARPAAGVNKIQVLDPNGGGAGVAGYVDTGALWTAGAYFDLKIVTDRAAQTYKLCLNGASIYTGPAFAKNTANIAIIGNKGTGTQNNILDVDNVVIDNTNYGTCDGLPPPHAVTPSVGNGTGTIAPSTVQTVVDGATTSFTLTPGSGFHIDTVAGTCGGSLAGNVYTTAPVTADCTVIANFAADVVTHAVTPSVGNGTGTIAPSTVQTVNDGATTSFTLTAGSGFHIDTVAGTCGGSLAGNVYTTSPVTTDCTVIANFAADTATTHAVTPSVGTGTGTIAPSTVQTVNDGTTTSFTLTAGIGFHIDTVAGTCGGSLVGNVYTTAPVTADCTVIANFAANTATTHAVTPSVGTGTGTIAPSTVQTVNDGATTSFTLTAGNGFHIDTVAGTCGGSLVGNVYTTNPVTTDCTVIANFAANVVTHAVTPSVGTGTGTIAPSTVQTVNDGASTSFTLTAGNGFHIDTVAGTCGGSLTGNVYTTNPVTADCTVIANFAANVVTHAVTPSVGTGTGTIAPSTVQTVNDGATTSFTLTAGNGFHIDTVAGTCGGSLTGNVYTTAPVTADCTVIANFAANVVTHAVTPSVGTGTGTIAPSTVQTVNDGATTSFTLTAGNGFHIDTVAGTCGGSLTGNVYTTAAITADCTVIANFAANTSNVVCSNPLNYSIASDNDGSYFGWVSGQVSDNSFTGWNFNPYGSGGNLAFYWGGTSTGNAGVAASATGRDWLVLHSGDSIGPSSTFSAATGQAINWNAALNGYVGFKFNCSAGVCYGYAHMTTTGATGFPATLVDYCYDSGGVAITIAGGGSTPPSVTKAFSPSTVAANANSTATITLANPNATLATLSANLVDSLPNGLVASAASTTCGGTAGFTAGTITLPAGSTIPANGSCTITATVHSANDGSYVNTIPVGGLATDLGSNAAAASATLTVSSTPVFPAPYCNVAFPSAVEPITRVVLTGIDNPSSATVDGSPVLENFLAVAGGTVSRGGTYSMAVEGNTAGEFTDKVKAYIDWNQNGTFEANEGYTIGDIADSSGTDGVQAVADILVPTDALLGTTRMRVIKKFNSLPDACNSAGYGQAEDYTLTVNGDSIPAPNASVTPSSFTLTAEQGGSASGTMTVSNSGTGQLTFDITRALPAKIASKRVDDVARRRLNDARKAALSGELPPLLQANWADVAAGGKPVAGTAVLLGGSDPQCDVGTPGLIVHDHDGNPDNGYGWFPAAGNAGRLVDKFTPSAYPGTFNTVCVTLISNAGLTSAPVKLVVYDDDGTGGGPGTELGSVSATANNIGSGLAKQFQAFDISSMNLSIASGSVYIGVEWDPEQVAGLFVAVDLTSAITPTGQQYTAAAGVWSAIVETTGREQFKSLYVRAIEGSGGEPGEGCDAPSNVPWLSVNPASGSIAGGGSTDVTVLANTTGLAVGTHTALICVNTNDVAHPRFEIPLSLTVTASVPEPCSASDKIFCDGFEIVDTSNPNVHDSGVIDLAIPDTFDGVYLNWADGSHCTDGACGGNINAYSVGDAQDPLDLHFFWPNAQSGNEGGVGSAANSRYTVLAAGATVGPSSEFITVAGDPPADMSNWIAGVDGYLGFKFGCSGPASGVCYGYAHLTTTAPHGFPAKIVRYWYDTSGAAITIP